jgi:hypothetical protein
LFFLKRNISTAYSSAVCLQLHKTAICKTGKCDIAKSSYGNATIQEVVEANDNFKISKPMIAYICAFHLTL